MRSLLFALRSFPSLLQGGAPTRQQRCRPAPVFLSMYARHGLGFGSGQRFAPVIQKSCDVGGSRYGSCEIISCLRLHPTAVIGALLCLIRKQNQGEERVWSLKRRRFDLRSSHHEGVPYVLVTCQAPR
ncbi:hypothetical protein AAHC03_0992 [Spirometra sp. Aus1]